MSFTPAMVYNKAAFDQNVNAVRPQAFTDNVAIVGNTVNRMIAAAASVAGTMNPGATLANSAGLVVNGSYTVASGVSGDVLNVIISVATSASSDMSSPTTLVSATTVAVPWVSDASGREFCVTLPVNFAGAGQYVQATVKLHGVGTGTYSAEVAGAVWSLGGLSPTPTPAFASTGWVGNAT